MTDEREPDRNRLTVRGRRAGIASAAKLTPEERSARSSHASSLRWERWRAERGITTTAETTENRRPDDGLDAFMDEVLREFPSWSLAKARREAALRQRKASADLAWDALKAKSDAAPRLPSAPERDEDDA